MLVGTRSRDLIEKAGRIRFLITDCDGVLTDGGVYVSEAGEVFKRFSLRDGMGVERLRVLAGIETGLISGENSGPTKMRVEKLGIRELHLGIKNKIRVFEEILRRRELDAEEVAYIGDDVNDLEVLKKVGLSGCPSDAVDDVRESVEYVCRLSGGHGAFREFAELILTAVTRQN